MIQRIIALCATLFLFAVLSTVSLNANTIMSNGIYSIQSDIFDSTASYGQYFSGSGIYSNISSGGQGSVVGNEYLGISTNFSGFVPEGGSAPFFNTNQKQHYSTFALALASANKGDEIHVDPGTYIGQFNLTRKTNLRIVAQTWFDSLDNTSTVISGNNNIPAVSMSNAFAVRFIGFTVKNGTFGVFSSSSSPNSNYIAHNVFYNNKVGVGVTNGNFNTITSNIVHVCSNGVYITGTSRSNVVFANTFISNMNGVYVDHDSAVQNWIYKNRIRGNRDNGIWIVNGDGTSVISNSISRNTNYGIQLSGSANGCSIISNSIYSNGGNLMQEGGIGLLGVNNTVISRNNIFNNSQSQFFAGSCSFLTLSFNTFSGGNFGIYFDAGLNNRVFGNSILNNSSSGLRMIWGQCKYYSIVSNEIRGTGGAGTGIEATGGNFNYFTNNRIARWGTGVQSGTISGCTNQIFFKNTVCSNASFAFDISASHQLIARNLIFKNGYGIRVQNSSNDYIINNTVYKSTVAGSDGILWGTASSGSNINNIILSNVGGAGSYGITSTSLGAVYASYNDIYGNLSGPTNGGIIWGPGNSFNDPLLSTVTGFTISTAFSPAVDNGTTNGLMRFDPIPIQGTGRDMGWKESSFTFINQGPYYVDNSLGNDANVGTINHPFKTVQKAVTRMAPGINVSIPIAHVMPGNYSNRILIQSNKTGLVMALMAASNNNLPNIIPASNFGLKITNTKNILVRGLRFAKQTADCMVLAKTISNIQIQNCVFVTNTGSGNGIALTGALNCTFISNRVSSGSSTYGFNIKTSTNIRILAGNRISGNQYGIYITTGWRHCAISHSTFISNSVTGIYTSSAGATSNTYASNTFLGSGQPIGMRFNPSYNSTVIGNVFSHNSTYSFSLASASSGNIIANNTFSSNNGANGALLLTVGGGRNRIAHNTFISNMIGINVVTSTNNIICSNFGFIRNQTAIDINTSSGSNFIFNSTFLSNQIGVQVANANKVRVFRNLIFGGTTGIKFKSASLNAGIYNNTIYKCLADGILITNTSTATLKNNIFLSNGSAPSGYGLRRGTTGVVYSANNDFYGNFTAPTNGAVTWGGVNQLGDPLLNTAGPFDITSVSSAAFDSGVTNGLMNLDPTPVMGAQRDMGWKESSFGAINQGPFYVDAASGSDGYLGTLAQPFRTIQYAANRMAPAVNVTSATTYVFPGTYVEQVSILSNKNSRYMTFINMPGMSMPILHGAGTTNYGFYILDADKVRIQGLGVRRFSITGIYLNGTATSNIIIGCEVSSNANYGIYTSGAGVRENTIFSNMVHGSNQAYGLGSQNADHNFYMKNRFIHNTTYGMMLNWGAVSNIIKKNEFSSNTSAGILLQGNDTRFNRIESNSIFGPGQSIGISLDNVTRNIVRSNSLYKNSWIGVRTWSSASNNNIIRNSVWSNGNYGIDITQPGSWYNTVRSNTVYGNQNGIYLEFSSASVVSYNDVYNNSDTGINLQSTYSNSVVHNQIYDNVNSGVGFNGNSANNSLVSNEIHGPAESSGIAVNNSSSNLIARNLIRDHFGRGINVTGSANRIQIINNTIFHCATQPAVEWQNTTSGTMANNIILSNSNWGISSSSSGPIDLLNNCFFGNTPGNMTGGGFGIVSANKNGNPRLETVTSFTITGPGAAVDNGIVITGISENYKHYAPDIGWKESDYTNINYKGPYYVDDDNGDDSNPGTLSSPFQTIQRAVTAMSPGLPACTSSTTFVFPGTYPESISIGPHANLAPVLIAAYSNDRKPLLFGGNIRNRGFDINNATNIRINGFIIDRFMMSGVYLQGDDHGSRILHCEIRSNQSEGISLNSHDIIIASNLLSGPSQNYGVMSAWASNNSIVSNTIRNHWFGGIYLNNNSPQNIISLNMIVSNQISGIYNNREENDGIVINQNDISGQNTPYGIYNEFADNTIIRSNRIHNIGMNVNDTAIWVGSSVSNVRILNNQLNDNNQIGIYVQSAIDAVVQSNQVIGFSHVRGLYMISCVNTVVDGNTFHAPRYGIYASGIFSGLVIRNNIMRSNQWNGFYSQGTVNQLDMHDNRITRGNGAAIYVRGQTNLIYKNTISSNGGQGVYIWSANLNQVYSNTLKKNTYGIYLETSSTNLIYGNIMRGSAVSGIDINGISPMNQVYSNTLSSNQYGISCSSMEKNSFFGNSIRSNSGAGLYLFNAQNAVFGPGNIMTRNYRGVNVNNATMNIRIAQNIFSNNSQSGLECLTGSANNFVIASNIFSGSSQMYGLDIANAVNFDIYRNVIRRSSQDGVRIWGSANNIKLLNNVFYKCSSGSQAVQFNDSANGTIQNNIFLSNLGYGLNSWSSGGYTFDNNCFYGNSSGTVGGSFVPGANTVYADPKLSTVSGFTISSALSAAANSGTTIPPITDGFQSTAPDMGWKESGYGPSDYVHILLPTDTWHGSIGAAVAVAPNNSIIEVYRKVGGFNEAVTVSGRRNITIRAYDWVYGGDNTASVVNASGWGEGFRLINSTNITILGLTVRSSIDNGILVTGNSISNNILHNFIRDNNHNGIRIEWQQAAGVEIRSNTISYNAVQPDSTYHGIILDSTSNVRIMGNVVSRNGNTGGESGIAVNSSSRILIDRNFMGSNNKNIYIGSSRFVRVSSNTIVGQQSGMNEAGIHFQGAGHFSNVAVRNTIQNANYGIQLNNFASSIRVSSNTISAPESGIYLDQNSCSNSFTANTVKNSGIAFQAADNTVSYLYVAHNTFVSNKALGSRTGIYHGGSYSTYNSNIISVNESGFVLRGNKNTLIGNNIRQNLVTALSIQSTFSNQIHYNRIVSNTGTSGIYADNSADYLTHNEITRNSGIAINIINGPSFSYFTKNNVYSNGSILLANASGSPFVLTNNWFGSTRWSVISPALQNNNTQSYISPWRLFGKFSTVAGDDTDRMPSVSWVTAFVTNSSQVKVKWTRPSDLTGFDRYFVYYSLNSGSSNLDRSSVVAEIGSSSTTNWVHSAPPSGPNLYYHVTALDSSSPFTNESWYSPEATTRISTGSLTLYRNINVNSYSLYPFATNNLVMSVHVQDPNAGSRLRSFVVQNPGTLQALRDVKRMKLWLDADHNNLLSPGDSLVSLYQPTGSDTWQITNLASGPLIDAAGIDLLITIDITNTPAANTWIQATIPVGGVSGTSLFSSPNQEQNIFQQSIPAGMVLNKNRNIWHPSIMDAFNQASSTSNTLLWAWPATYSENNLNTGSKSISLVAYDWLQNKNNGSTIVNGMNNGIFQVNSGHFDLTGFTITNETWGTAIDYTLSTGRIAHNHISSPNGISVKQGSFATIESNYISTHNRQQGITVVWQAMTGAGVIVRSNVITGCQGAINIAPTCYPSTIINNRIVNNFGTALSLNSSTTLAYNFICDNTGDAVSLNAMGVSSLVLNNTISYNGGNGISINNMTTLVRNNIVAFNNWGINATGGTTVLSYNDVYGNTSGNYNSISQGPNDISLNPLFVDAAGRDLHLTSASPCIAAGMNYIDQGCYPFQADLLVMRGSMTMPAGGIGAEQSGTAMVQVNLENRSGKLVVLTRLTVTNNGSSASALPLESTNARLYQDVNNDGILSAGDILLDGSAKFIGTTSIFSNFTLNIPTGTTGHVIVLYDMHLGVVGEKYVATVSASGMLALTNGSVAFVAGNVTGNTQTISGVLDHFVIQHTPPHTASVVSKILIKAVDSTGVPVGGYSGVVTLSVLGETASITWQTNGMISYGTLNDLGAGDDRGIYTFNPAENGATEIGLICTGLDTINIQVKSGLIVDDDTEGSLVFDPPAAFNVTQGIYYRTIQGAVNAVPGGTHQKIWLIKPGIIAEENILIDGKDLVLESEGWAVSSDPNFVTVQASANNLFVLKNNSSVTMLGFQMSKATWNRGVDVSGQSRLFASHCTIYSPGNSDNGIYGTESSLITLISNEIRNCGSAVFLTDNMGTHSRAVLYGNRIYHNNSAGIQVNNGASIYMVNNDICSNVSDGISMNWVWSNTALISNRFFNNSGRGVAVTSSPYMTSIAWNQINNNNSGGLSLSSALIDLNHNTISENSGTGIDLQWTSAQVRNNIIANNAGVGMNVNNGSVINRYNDVYGQAPNYQGITQFSNEISLDPVFKDSLNQDYHLSSISPAIASAENYSDMGCYPYYHDLHLFTGASTKPKGGISPAETGIPIFQFRLNGHSQKNVTVTRIEMTNFGTSSFALPLEMTNLSLYVDVNNNGLKDGGDTPLSLNKRFLGTKVVFSNFSTVINAGTDKNLLVVVAMSNALQGENYRLAFFGNGITCTTNGSPAEPIGFATSTTQTVSGGFNHFVITHDGSGYAQIPEHIVLSAVDAAGTPINNYTGTVTLSVLGESGEVSWKTNGSMTAYGTLTDFGLGDDRATYVFAALDFGSVDLMLRDNGADILNVEAKASTGETDNNSEGLFTLYVPLVWNITHDTYHATLLDAILGATTNTYQHLRIIRSGTNKEQMVRVEKRNIFLDSSSWASNLDNTAKVLATTNNLPVFCVTNATMNIQGLTFQGGFVGFGNQILKVVSGSMTNRNNVFDGFNITGEMIAIYRNGTMSLISNEIKRSSSYGVYVYEPGSFLNTRANRIYHNSYGVRFNMGTSGNMWGDTVMSNSWAGIDLGGSGVSNVRIARSQISNNNNYGIYHTWGGGSVEIVSNRVLNNISGTAINLNGGGSFRIYRNIIAGNQTGINVNGGSHIIVQNTIDHNAVNGIYMAGNLTVFNNIVSSNGNNGIFWNSGSHIVNYNNVYGNFNNYMGMGWPGKDIQQDPRYADRINMDYRLTNNSPSFDKGTNLGLPYVTSFNGLAPDQGAIESSYIPYTGPFYVHPAGSDGNSGSILAPFQTIQHAANIMMPGVPACTFATTYVAPGTYYEGVSIMNNLNAGKMVFIQWSNMQPKPVVANPGGRNRGFDVDARNVIIKGFKIRGFNQEGIALNKNCTSNEIRNNEICSNNNNGIFAPLMSASDVIILSNEIYRIWSGPGINIQDGHGIAVAVNKIHDLSGTGLQVNHTMQFWVLYNTIWHVNQGANLYNVTNFSVANNFILSNNNEGLNISGGNSSISNNTVFRVCQNNGNGGISLSGINYRIIKNTILSNVDWGMNYHDGLNINGGSSSNMLVFSNTIAGVRTGINVTGADRIYLLKNIISSTQGSAINVSSNWGGGTDSQSRYVDIRSNILLKSGINISDGIGHIVNGNILLNQTWRAMYILRTPDILVENNILSGGDRGIELTHVSGRITGNTIVSNRQDGMWVDYMTNSVISNNTQSFAGWTGWGSSISFGSNTRNIRIVRNTFFSNVYNSTNFLDGISIGNPTSSQIEIRSNIFAGIGRAINVSGADQIRIVKNWIISPGTSGGGSAIEIRSNNSIFSSPDDISMSNTIASNTIIGRGIQVRCGGDLIVEGNNILNIANNQGSSIQNVNGFTFKENRVRHCQNALQISSGQGSVICNSFISNGLALQPDNGSIVDIKHNLFQANSNQAYRVEKDNGPVPNVNLRQNNFENNRINVMFETNLDVRSNWWGSSVKSAIVSGFGGSSATVPFEPYRLWHKYNLKEGADVYATGNITSFTAVVAGLNVDLKWNTINDPDLVRYVIYRSMSSDYGALQHAVNVFTSTVSTNFVDTPGKGIFNYWITALDDPASAQVPINTLTNESWYSPLQTVTIGTGTNVYNVQKMKHYNTIADAINDADGSGTYNEILVKVPGIYNEHDISMLNDQNIQLVSREWLEKGSATNTIISATDPSSMFIIKARNNAQLNIRGFTFLFAGTNGDWGMSKVAAGIYFADMSSGSIQNSIFKGLNTGRMAVQQGANGSAISIVSNMFMGFNGSSVHLNRFALVKENKFEACGSGVGIDSVPTGVTVTNNEFKKCSSGVMTWGSGNGVHIVFNLFRECQRGVECNNNSSPEIVNNTIAHGGYAGIFVDFNSSPLILNNILFSNSFFGIKVIPSAAPVVQYNNAYGAFSNNYSGFAPEPNNIQVDPLFVGYTSKYDYHLTGVSPSISAGLNGVDQGCYPYNSVMRIATGAGTRPAGTFARTQNDIAMLQIRLTTETPMSAELRDITITNLGSSSSNMPLDINNIKIYADVNNNGLVDGPDVMLKSQGFGGQSSATLNSINLTMAGNKSTNLIIAYDSLNATISETYVVQILRGAVIARTNSVNFTVTGSAQGNPQTVSGGIHHFVISHSTNYYSKIPARITFAAMDSNNLIVSGYTGTISLWVGNTNSQAYWTNISANGKLTNLAPAGSGQAYYTFSALDNGRANLFLVWATNGTQSIECVATNLTTATDNDIEGPLYFTVPPVWNFTLNRRYGNLQSAINNAQTDNEIRIMYSYKDGNTIFASTNTAAQRLWITSDLYRTSGVSSVTMNVRGRNTGIKVQGDRRIKLQGFTITFASNDGVDLINNTTFNTIRNMVFLSNGKKNFSSDPAGMGILSMGDQTGYNAIISNTIIGSGAGILVYQSDNEIIEGNQFYFNVLPFLNGPRGGIVIASDSGLDSTNILVLKNLFYSNTIGVDMSHGGANISKVRIVSNSFIQNRSGVYMDSSDGNEIANNSFSRQDMNGVMLADGSDDNRIHNNDFYSNSPAGMNVTATNPRAYRNQFYDNRSVANKAGIFLRGAIDSSIYDTSPWIAGFTYNTNAVVLFSCTNLAVSNLLVRFNNAGVYARNSSNLILKRNQVERNNFFGVVTTNAVNSVIIENSIRSNYYGMWLMSGSASFARNNIFENTTNVIAPINGAGQNYTNNWWGFTAWSNILGFIAGRLAPPPSSALQPWRLFGPFDLDINADRDRAPSVVGLTANTNAGSITLAWNRSDDPDTVRYFIYRSTVDDFTNWNRSFVIAVKSGLTSTNYTDTPSTNRRWYYRVTALDDGLPGAGLTNESWYSAVATASNSMVQNYGPFFVDDDAPASDSNPGTRARPFRTIQHAANIMMPGMPNCTVASTYVFPGTYSEKVTIASNKNLGNMVFTRLSNTQPVLDGALSTNFAFKLTNASKIHISGLIIKKFIAGVSISGSSTNNLISANSFYSNIQAGVYFTGADVRNSSIFSNTFSGFNQTNGIKILDGYRNLLRKNVIHQNNVGIYLAGSAYSNVLSLNQAYSNNPSLNGTGSFGIALNGVNVRYNTIMSNTLSGSNQKVGIYLNRANHNLIANDNRFTKNYWYGIQMIVSAQSNRISGNTFYSNLYGLILSSGNVNYNTITNNLFYGGQRGLHINSASNNFVKNNGIFRNDVGIGLNGTARLNLISANTIYSNNNGPNSIGIQANGAGVNNNIFWSNSIFGPTQLIGIAFTNAAQSNRIVGNRIYANATHGIYLNGDSVKFNIIASNDIFGPGQGNGIDIYSADGNMIKDNNRIYLNSSYGIYLQGTAQTNEITGNQIYNNSVVGINFNGDTIKYNSVSSNGIYGPGQVYGIFMTAADKNSVRNNNSIYKNTYGIYMSGSAQTNRIAGNSIFSNSARGVYLTGNDVRYNTIISNRVFGASQAYGIQIENGCYNNIIRNLFNNAKTNAISLINATNIKIFNNTILKAGQDGVLANNSTATLYNNILLSNGSYGFKKLNSGISYLGYNDFYNNTSGSTNGWCIWGTGNVINDPWLNSSAFFAIAFDYSSAVDSGTTNGLMSLDPAPISGSGRDMGWKESAFIAGTPILDLSKSASAVLIKPYQELTYAIRYSNASPYILRYAQIVDVIPVECLLLTNSAEISNTYHSGSATIEYSTNYWNGWWTNSSFDAPATVQKIKKIKWTLNSDVLSGEKGIIKFKVIVK